MNNGPSGKEPAQKEARREYMRRWRMENRERVAEYHRKWAEGNEDRKAYTKEYNRKMWANPEIRERERGRWLLMQYGITSDDFNSLWDEQDGKCAVCEVPMKPRGRGKYSAAVDHNHETGEVRGLLCGSCNRGIGHLRDDPKTLQKAADYLYARGFSKCMKGFENE